MTMHLMKRAARVEEFPMTDPIRSVSFDVDSMGQWLVTVRRRGREQEERYAFESRKDAERFCQTLR
jgi:hypothetical protein